MVMLEEVLITSVRLLGGAEGAVGREGQEVSHLVMRSSDSPAEEVLTNTLAGGLLPTPMEAVMVRV